MMTGPEENDPRGPQGGKHGLLGGVGEDRHIQYQ
jgi:hypothetical protein